MTTCFRPVGNALHPHLRSVKNNLICYRLKTLNVKFQSCSSFLEKFLEKSDDEILIEKKAYKQECLHKSIHILFPNILSGILYQLHLNRTEKVPLSCAQAVEVFPLLQKLQRPHLLSFDPVYVALKPVTSKLDDIHETKDIMCLEEDIICKIHYTITMVPAQHLILADVMNQACHSSPLSEFEMHVINMANESCVIMNGSHPPRLNTKPTESQLDYVYKKMSIILPKFFTQAHDYSLYHPEIIFINNIRGVTTKGLSSYIQQLALVRIMGHIKFAHVRFEVLKITKHSEDGTVRVRWRIRGISGLKVLFNIWKVRLWDWKKLLREESDWYDGFSTFFVGSDGKIHRHVCDKMMPDDDKRPAILNKGLAAKLAVLVGVVQQPISDDISLLMSLLKPDVESKSSLGK